KMMVRSGEANNWGAWENVGISESDKTEIAKIANKVDKVTLLSIDLEPSDTISVAGDKYYHDGLIYEASMVDTGEGDFQLQWSPIGSANTGVIYLYYYLYKFTSYVWNGTALIELGGAPDLTPYSTTEQIDQKLSEKVSGIVLQSITTEPVDYQGNYGSQYYKASIASILTFLPPSLWTNATAPASGKVYLFNDKSYVWNGIAMKEMGIEPATIDKATALADGLLSKEDFAKLLTLTTDLAGKANKATLLSVDVAPTGSFVLGDLYYNLAAKKLYDYSYVSHTTNLAWQNGGDPKAGTIYIFGTSNYMWNGVELVKTGDTADKAEAEGGIEPTKVMTAIRVWDAIKYLLANFSFSALTSTSKTIIGAINGKVDAATGYSLVANTEISKIHSAGSDAETNATIATLITAAIDQSTTAPADTDTIVLGKGSSFNKLTIANFVVWLKSIFETVITSNSLTPNLSTTDIVPDFSYKEWISYNSRFFTETVVTNSSFLNLPTTTCFRSIIFKNLTGEIRNLILKTTGHTVGSNLVASGTGTVSGTTLTLSSVTGTFLQGHIINVAGVSIGSYITEQLTSTSAIGIDVASTIVSHNSGYVVVPSTSGIQLGYIASGTGIVIGSVVLAIDSVNNKVYLSKIVNSDVTITASFKKAGVEGTYTLSTTQLASSAAITVVGISYVFQYASGYSNYIPSLASFISSYNFVVKSSSTIEVNVLSILKL
ncbi:MAG: hypothetical protein WCJ61_01730, partial [Paludibacter sp.]